MEFIRSLAPFIDHEKFAESLNGGRHLGQLFDLIRGNRVESDAEAIAELYGDHGGADAYKQLRLRLEQKLIDYISLNGIEYKNLDTYTIRYRKCLQQLTVVKTLGLSNARSMSIPLGEKLMKQASRYEFTDIAMQVALDLFFYYTCIEYSQAKADKYGQLVDLLFKRYSNEVVVFRYYCEMKVLFSTSRGGYRGTVVDKSLYYLNEVSRLLQSADCSYLLVYFGYRVIAMYFEIKRDIPNLLRICDEAIHVLQKRSFSRVVAIYIYKMIKITCFIQLGNYREVEQLAQPYFEIMTKTNLNWFALKSYIVINRLHAGNYQQAHEVMHEMTTNRSYQKLPQYILQTFTVYEAHVEFLIAIGKVETDEPSKFRLNKFLNEIPIYTKDKQGMNIAILIIHVLFLLHRRKYAQIIDRTDALKQYCYRYLKKDDTYRSHCFIRMLLQMPRADFNRMRTVRYAEPYLKKLNAMPLHLSAQSIEVEIIPYEALWDMTLDLLY